MNPYQVNITPLISYFYKFPKRISCRNHFGQNLLLNFLEKNLIVTLMFTSNDHLGNDNLPIVSP